MPRVENGMQFCVVYGLTEGDAYGFAQTGEKLRESTPLWHNVLVPFRKVVGNWESDGVASHT